MPKPKTIASAQNPLIKKVLALKEKARERKKTGLFVIEGQRELQLAVKGGYEIETLLYCAEITHNTWVAPVQNCEIVQVPPSLYQKLAHRGSTEGVIALARSKDHAITSLHFKNEQPLLLVAESPEKPGNLGALLRTADAADLDAVLIADPTTDLYNSNVIRSSVGCLFTTHVGVGTTEEIIQFLKERKINIFCAALTASKNYIEADFTKPAAIVVGTESTGLSDTWTQHSNQNIVIPMLGEIDSMNLSVSAAILIFEAKRQRGY